jgi:hypothetical protein
LGVRLTTSPCKKKFVENLLRKEILEEAKALWAVVPLIMMLNKGNLLIIFKFRYTPWWRLGREKV